MLWVWTCPKNCNLVEAGVGKGYNACNQHYIIFPQRFQSYQRQIIIYQHAMGNLSSPSAFNF